MRNTTPTFFVKNNKNILTKINYRVYLISWRNIMELSESKEESYAIYFLNENLIKLCKKYNRSANGSKENILVYIENQCFLAKFIALDL
jgi:hypothetical protein